MATGCQNGAKINAKTHQKQSNNRSQKILGISWKIVFFWCVKPCKSTILSSKNKVSQGEYASTDNYKKNIKMTPNSIPKSMKTPYKFHARKSDAKNTENHQTCTPKGSPKPLRIHPKINPKNIIRKEDPAPPWGSPFPTSAGRAFGPIY